MKKFDSSKWITENKYGKLPEDADPTKQDDTRFPTKLSAVDKTTATAYSDQGDFDGEKEDDVISKVSDSWPVTALKPSQTSMNIKKGLAFALGMIKDDNPGGDLDAFISSDMHIMDGHHRWIASGMVDPTSNLGGHKLNYPAMKLVAVLNTLTKGEFNVPVGKNATGGFDQFSAEPIKKQLEDYLVNGAGDAIDQETGDPNPFHIPAEGVQAAIEKFTGVQGEEAKQAAVNKFVANISKLTFKLPPGAPGREDMPVIDKPDVKTAIDKITTGDVDVNPPYGDGKGEKRADKAAVSGLAEDSRASLYERIEKIINKSLNEYYVDYYVVYDKSTGEEVTRFQKPPSPERAKREAEQYIQSMDDWHEREEKERYERYTSMVPGPGNIKSPFRPNPKTEYEIGSDTESHSMEE